MKQGYLSVFFLLLYSCAIQVPPQGGDPDRTPPVLLSAMPPDQSTGFTAHEIVLEFDENIQLKDLNSQLLISPPLKRQPLAKVRKNKLYISIDDTLTPNATYCFNFGSAITDLNEGNAITDFTYVVSTGSIIDTLKFSGMIVRSEDLKPEEGAVVSLYTDRSDSTPYKELPRYYGRTGKDGSFVIGNLASGSYRIFALRENNNNYLFDDPSERIAFDTNLLPVPAVSSIRLYTFQREGLPRFVKASAPLPGKIQAIFTAPASTDSIHWLTGRDYLGLRVYDYQRNNDTLDFWYTNPEADTAAFVIAREQRQDTVQLMLKKKTGTKRSPLALTLSSISRGAQAPHLPLTVSLPFPMAWVSTPLIHLSSDSIDQPFTIDAKNPDSLQFDIHCEWKEAKEYTVAFLPGALKDILGNTNDTLIESFPIKERSDYGTLKINLTGMPNGQQRILQILDEKENMIASTLVKADTICFYDYLSPSRLRLKWVDDANKNGKWDTGNDLLHQQPERVGYYTDPVPVRANWDVEIKWQLKD